MKNGFIVKLIKNKNQKITTKPEVKQHLKSKENLFLKSSKISEIELDNCIGGRMDGIVNFFGEKIGAYVAEKEEKGYKNFTSKIFWDTVYFNSDKIVEGSIGVLIVGLTIGISKLVNYCEKELAKEK